MTNRWPANLADVATIRLHFLGPPRIERDGRLVEPDTRKATALLAYLAVTGERPSRDFLAAFLWPEFDDSRARAALRRTLSALKATIYAEIGQETGAWQPEIWKLMEW